MKVLLDGTPLLGARTGVGRYVYHLARSLPSTPASPEIVLTAFTIRDASGLSSYGLRVSRRPVPARAIHWLWQRSEWPALETLSTSADVYHGTNFVLPPSRRARGIVTIHDLAYLRVPEAVSAASRKLRDLVPVSVRRADFIVTPSEAVRQEVLDAYPVGADRVRVTPLGVDPQWFDPARRPDGPLAAAVPHRYILFVGTLEPRKNLEMLVEAHRAALATEPCTPPLVLAGLAGWGRQVPPQPGVVPLGYVSDSDLRALVANALAVALPSIAEGFGLPVLEALASGTPVLASDIAALREVGGSLCRYAAPDDTDAWAELLVTSGCSDGEREEGDVVARQDWARQWTWERTAQTTVQAYEDAGR